MTKDELLKSRENLPPMARVSKRPDEPTSKLEVKKKLDDVAFMRELKQIEKEAGLNV